MYQVVHHTLSSSFTHIQIFDFNGDHLRHIGISNLSGLTKHNFGREALGCKKGFLLYGSNGKRTLIITPHQWMRSEEGSVKNNWMAQLGV